MKRKEQILQEIAKLMYEKGYEKTSMRDISRSSNISKPGLYYHFENKQEILFSIIDGFLDKNISELKKELTKCGTPQEKLFCIINNHIQSFVKYPAQTKVVIYEIHSLNKEYSKKLKPRQMELSNIVKNELSSIMSETGVQFDINVATFCLMGILAWIIQWYKPKGKVKPDMLANDICRFFLNGLGVKISK
ncbi:MAG: TetR/AcrR family transcriptional regulator [Deltaproteobacteria bacterium]|nr:TetR/AcrR family transcriptional regulator [Deltaproteobacteria bacterium]